MQEKEDVRCGCVDFLAAKLLRNGELELECWAILDDDSKRARHVALQIHILMPILQGIEDVSVHFQ